MSALGLSFFLMLFFFYHWGFKMLVWTVIVKALQGNSLPVPFPCSMAEDVAPLHFEP